MSDDVDLFGQQITARQHDVEARRRKRVTGYAAPPGSGPSGETCRSCRHYTRVAHARVYRKCALLRAHWTNGPGTDILARSPACARWEKRADG